MLGGLQDETWEEGVVARMEELRARTAVWTVDSEWVVNTCVSGSGTLPTVGPDLSGVKISSPSSGSPVPRGLS